VWFVFTVGILEFADGFRGKKFNLKTNNNTTVKHTYIYVLRVSYYRVTTYGLWINISMYFIFINSTAVMIIRRSLINIYVILHGG